MKIPTKEPEFFSLAESVGQSGDEDLAERSIRGRTILGLAAAALRHEFPDVKISPEQALRMTEIMLSPMLESVVGLEDEDEGDQDDAPTDAPDELEKG